jgi:hypothetical protein
MWRVRVLEKPFGLLLRFIYDFTSRHYNYFYNVRSSLPCWFCVLVGPLIADFLVAALIWLLWSAPDVASLIGSFDLLFWRCASDLLLWSPLTLRLWSAPLICPFFNSFPPWNRVLAPRIEDTLSKGKFSPVVQVVTGITFVNIRCGKNNCLPSRCLGIAIIHLSNVTCIW